jgi:hypothetical protein
MATTTTTTTASDDLEDLEPSAFFTRILRQSGSTSSSIRQQPVLQAETEKILVRCASLFAHELVSKSASVAQRRAEKSSSAAAIRIDDVNFVLKHQWPVYDSSSYSRVTEH